MQNLYCVQYYDIQVHNYCNFELYRGTLLFIVSILKLAKKLVWIHDVNCGQGKLSFPGVKISDINLVTTSHNHSEELDSIKIRISAIEVKFPSFNIVLIFFVIQYCYSMSRM